MKVSVTETIRKTIDMHFDKYIKVPKWVYDYSECENCGVQFDDEYFYDDVIVAVGKDGDGHRKYYHYCLKCWKKEEEPYINAKEYRLAEEQTYDSIEEIDRSLKEKVCVNLEYILYPEDLNTFSDHVQKRENAIYRYDHDLIFHRYVNVFTDCIMSVLKRFRFISKK